MISSNTKPSIREFLQELGYHPTRNRCKGPCHDGDNPGAFSFDEDKNVWFCHRCGIGGDVFTLAMTVMDTDFAGALRHFGLEPGKPPIPDPEAIRRRRIREGLERWARETGRRLRDEFYTRELVIVRALERLRRDAEDVWSWSWLAWALKGQAALEHALDMVDIGTEQQRITAYRQWRVA